jgi:hypothetical protein
MIGTGIKKGTAELALLSVLEDVRCTATKWLAALKSKPKVR